MLKLYLCKQSVKFQSNTGDKCMCLIFPDIVKTHSYIYRYVILSIYIILSALQSRKKPLEMIPLCVVINRKLDLERLIRAVSLLYC